MNLASDVGGAGVPASVAERERFEAWVREKCGEDYDRHDYELLLDRYGPDCGTLAGRYVRPLIHARWSGWEAAMAPPPPRLTEAELAPWSMGGGYSEPPHFMGHGGRSTTDSRHSVSDVSGKPGFRASFDVRVIDDWTMITSKQCAGFYLANPNADLIFRDLLKAWRLLYELNGPQLVAEPPPTSDTKGREEARSDDHGETKSGGTAP